MNTSLLVDKVLEVLDLSSNLVLGQHEYRALLGQLRDHVVDFADRACHLVVVLHCRLNVRQHSFLLIAQQIN